MTENIRHYDNLPILEIERKVKTVVEQGFRVVIDAGCGNNISTNLNQTALIMVDPLINGLIKPDLGRNYIDDQSLVIRVAGYLSDLSGILANRLQMISPDPDFLLEMIGEGIDLVARGGKLIVVGDLISNKRDRVGVTMKEAMRLLEKGGWSVQLGKASQGQINRLIGGELNSEFIAGTGLVLLAKKLV